MNLFEIAAVLKLNMKDYEEGLDKAHEKAKGFASKASSAFGGLASRGLNALAGMAKAGVATVGAATTAVSALVKQSVSAYGQYEQLVGGAKLMFGEAYDVVAKNASQAYKTVQMSQSAYLQQVNGFATGLKTSMNGDAVAAANLAHKIVKAEADIVAATGQSTDAVQNAFNGLMRNNFTMLDNLQIGIKPTKEGFQEVIDKVNEWNEAQGRLTDYQMGNLADMQSALVDYIEMVGYAGYAGKEAGDTLQGSFASARAAWQDLVTGLADPNADIGALINNFTGSLIPAIQNVLPIIRNAMTGIGQAVPALAKTFIAEFTKFLKNDFPTLVSAGKEMLKSIITGIKENIGAIKDAIKDISDAIGEFFSGDGFTDMLDAGADILFAIIDGIIDNADKVIDAVVKVVDTLSGMFTPERVEKMTEAAISIVLALADGLVKSIDKILPAIGRVITGIITKLTENNNLQKIMDAGADLLGTLADHTADILDALGRALPRVINGISTWLANDENMSKIIEAGTTLFSSLLANTGEIVANLIPALGEIVSSLLEHLPEMVMSFLKGGVSGVSKLVANLIGPEELLHIGSGEEDYMAELGKEEIRYLGLAENTDEIDDKLARNFSSLFYSKIPNIITETSNRISMLPFARGKLTGEMKSAYTNLLEDTNIGEYVKFRIPDIMKAVESDFKNLGHDIANAITNGFISARDLPLSALKSLGADMKPIYSALIESGQYTGEDIVEGIEAGIITKDDLPVNALLGMGVKLDPIWDALVKQGEVTGGNMMDGFIAGAKSRIQGIIEKFQGYISQIKSVFTGVKGFDVHSPSKWAYGVMGHVFDGFENSIDARSGGLLRSAESMTASLKDSLTVDGATITKGANGTGGLYGLLATYLPMLANMKVVLQDGTLVGVMDTWLGERYDMAERGVAV